MIKIGLLGANGKIGLVVIDILLRRTKYIIKGGYRSSIPTLTNNRVEWTYVDIMDFGSLYSFCTGCNIIVNCAGPMHSIGDKIAEAAMEVNAIYVDSYGTTEIRKNIIEKCKADKGIYVLGCGAYPGLTGIMLKYTINQFDKIKTCIGMTGSCEKINKGAAIDLLYSNFEGYGILGAKMKDGNVELEKGISTINVNFPQFSLEKKALLYLPEEISTLVQKKKILDLEWYNILASEEYNKILASAYRNIISGKNIDMELINLQNLEIDRNWNVISIEAEGIRNMEKKHYLLSLHNESAYELTGMVLAFITIGLLEKKCSNGVYWAYDVVDCEKIILNLKKYNILVWKENVFYEKNDMEMGVL